MRVTSLEVQNMWSFGESPVQLQDFEQHNIIIGKNNCGKSKILAALRWICDHRSGFASSDHVPLEPDCDHDSGDVKSRPNPRMKLVVRLSPDELDDARAKMVEELQQRDQRWGVFLKRALGADCGMDVTRAENTAALKLMLYFNERSYDFSVFGIPSQQEQHIAQWKSAWARRLNAHVLELLERQLRYVSGWRALDRKVTSDHTIVQHLHVWRDPPQQDKHCRWKFTRIQDLFRRFLLCPEIEIRPEHNGQKLALSLGGRYLPIEAYGDGVQHLLMLSYHVATVPEGILLIEEPETHIHPELQRNMMKVLTEDFRGQTFITTHSPVLLDTSLASRVYRVEHDGKTTSVSMCKTTQDVYQVLDALDVRASDLLQANFVLWVEGPTDRMFINRCFELLRAGLTEGVDYQIAYYGGRVRSHFTFDEENAQSLVNLLCLCRHVAMLCDSDHRAEGDPLDATKSRLQRECEQAGGWYWVTAGREIENYFPDGVLTAAYKTLLDRPNIKVTLGRFESLDDAIKRAIPEPPQGGKWKASYEENKARIMPELLKHLTVSDLEHLGLETKLQELLQRIRSANGRRCGLQQ